MLGRKQHEQVLERNVDAVEACPLTPYTDIFATGLYELIEEKQEKVGSVLLWRMEQPGGGDPAPRLLQRVSTSAVFDIKWHSMPLGSARRPWLGEASADGCVRVYDLRGPGEEGGEGERGEECGSRESGSSGDDQDTCTWRRLHSLQLSEHNSCIFIDWSRDPETVQVM